MQNTLSPSVVANILLLLQLPLEKISLELFSETHWNQPCWNSKGKEERMSLPGNILAPSCPIWAEIAWLILALGWFVRAFWVNALSLKDHLESDGLWTVDNLLGVLKILLQVSGVSKLFIWFLPQPHILGIPRGLIGMVATPAWLSVCRHLSS